MKRQPFEINQADYDEHARQYADFLARGGIPEICPHGQMAANAGELRSKPGRAAATPAGTRLSNAPAIAEAPACVTAPHRVPNVEKFSAVSVLKPQRGPNEVTRLSAIAEAATQERREKAAKKQAAFKAAPAIDAAHDPKLTQWQRICAAFRACGNRWLYTGELRLMCGLEGNTVSVILSQNQRELESLGRKPFRQYRLLKP